MSCTTTRSTCTGEREREGKREGKGKREKQWGEREEEDSEDEGGIKKFSLPLFPPPIPLVSLLPSLSFPPTFLPPSLPLPSFMQLRHDLLPAL